MNLETVLENLMTPDTALIKQAQNALLEAYKFPETYTKLFHLMVYHEKLSIRQYAALLLRKRLSSEEHYKLVPLETRQDIKSSLLRIIFNESKECVRTLMAQLLAFVLVHENAQNCTWIDETLYKILDHLKSPNEFLVELGSSVLAKIALISSEIFLERFTVIGQVFEATLLTVETNIFALPEKVLKNILLTMSLIPTEMIGFNDVELFYQAAIPHIINVLQQMLINKAGSTNYVQAIEILTNIADYAPHLLDAHMKIIIEHIQSVGCNANYDAEMRSNALTCLWSIIKSRSVMLIKLSYIELIVTSIFHILSTEPDACDPEEFLTNLNDATPFSVAHTIMYTIAEQIPEKYFMNLLLQILENALNDQQNHLRRRAAFITIAAITEGCKDIICEKYLEMFVLKFKQGLKDAFSTVRISTLYAISNFCDLLQPDIVQYTNEMLPMLMHYAQTVVEASVQGLGPQTNNTERIFDALSAFCCTISDPYNPLIGELMKLIFSLLNSPLISLQIHAMELLDALARADSGCLVPWCEQLCQKFQPIIVLQSNNNTQIALNQETKELSVNAINAFAEIIRDCQDCCNQFSLTIFQACTTLIQSTVDVDERSALLNLMGAFSLVFGENFLTIMPIILQNIETCIFHGMENVGNDADAVVILNEQENDNIECMNSYSEARKQALLTIEELTRNCPNSLLKYADNIYQLLLKTTEHCCVIADEFSFDALKSFIVIWFHNDTGNGNGSLAAQSLIKKFADIVHNNFEPLVVIETLNTLCNIINEIGKNIFTIAPELPQLFAQIILDGLNFQYKCQRDAALTYDVNDKDDESYLDKSIIEKVFDLLACFGAAINLVDFATFFAKVEPLLLNHVQHANIEEYQTTFASFISSLAQCYSTLQSETDIYFRRHYQILMDSMCNKNSKTLKVIIFVLGNLCQFSGDIAFGYYNYLLQRLSEITASNPKKFVMESIIGVLARLIIKNVDLVPMEEILPVLEKNLSIVNDENELKYLFQCFRLLFQRFFEPMRMYVKPIVAKAIEISEANFEMNMELLEVTEQLLKDIRQLCPNEYRNATP